MKTLFITVAVVIGLVALVAGEIHITAVDFLAYLVLSELSDLRKAVEASNRAVTVTDDMLLP